MEEEVKCWIEEILEIKIGSETLQAGLKDGIILCELINKLLKDKENEVLKCPRKSNLSFFQMENIEYFINKARAHMVPEHEMFQTLDLYDNKSFKQVLICICSLSRNLYKNGIRNFRVIGPKLLYEIPAKK